MKRRGCWAQAFGKPDGTGNLRVPLPTISLDCAISPLVGRLQVLTGWWGLGFLKQSNLGFCILSLGDGRFLDLGRWDLADETHSALQQNGGRGLSLGAPPLARALQAWAQVAWLEPAPFPSPCAALSPGLSPGPPTGLLTPPPAVITDPRALGYRGSLYT